MGFRDSEFRLRLAGNAARQRWVAQVVGVAVLLGFLSGCGKEGSTTPMSANAVATVGGKVISRETFEKELARRAPALAGAKVSSEEKQALLDDLIRFEVLYQKALATGYDKDPEILANVKRMIVSKYQEDQLSRLGHATVSAEEVAEYYRRHADRFGRTEKVRAAIIELKVPRTAPAEKRAEVAKQAEALRAEAAANPPADGTFGLLAQNHSEDQASRYRGGDIGWLSVGPTNIAWDPAVPAAIFKLENPGDLAPVIETPTAFYLIKLIERRPAQLRPLADVKAGVEWLAAREKEHQQEQALYNALKQGLEIRTNQALLEAIRLSAGGSPPGGSPPGPPAGPGPLNAGARKP